MNIIFLDIDGVLNNSSTYDIFNSSCDPVCFYHFMNAFHEINNQLKSLKIVISSTWRGMKFSDFELVIKETRSEKLKELFPYLHSDWRTNHFSEISTTPREKYCRGYEIQDWLSRHPEIENYLIIDDDSDFIENQHYLQTNYDLGFGLFENEILKIYFLNTSKKYAYCFGRNRTKITTKNIKNFCLKNWI